MSGIRGKQLIVIAACTLTTFVAACGSSDEPSAARGAASDATRTAAATTQMSPEAELRAAERRRRLEIIGLERSFAPNPWREPGASRPHPHGRVQHLIVRDVARGRGPALRGDENVYANFVKTYWKNGEKFLAPWGRGEAEYLSLRSQAPGIARGMTGMRAGGRRVIVIPRAIADVHEPFGRQGWEDARMDVVLRKINPRE